MNPIPAIKGLYAITPDCPDTDELVHKARQALLGGASVLQYRNKAADAALRLEQAATLRKLTRELPATFIVNDDPQLALRVDADGVHLGAEDDSMGGARALMGQGKLIGISCYNRASLARQAIAAGADYVAFGAFFPSSVKPDAVVADIELLRRMRSELAVPLVTIGGITPHNAPALLEAGADALAVISAVFDAADIQTAARNFSKLFIQESAL